LNKPVPFIAVLMLTFACAAVPVFSAEGTEVASQYSLGDQTMSINAGLFVPLFLFDNNLKGGFFGSQLSFGAVGSLTWAAYVTPQIRLGADVGGNFTLSPNSNVLLMLPFVAKIAYIFTFYPFELPLSFGVGMNIVKYVDKSSLDLLLRPGASFYWIYNANWSFGVNLLYWFDMQFNKDSSLTRYGNFLEFSLSALYHF
jgi:hypothetical protein